MVLFSCQLAWNLSFGTFQVCVSAWPQKPQTTWHSLSRPWEATRAPGSTSRPLVISLITAWTT